MIIEKKVFNKEYSNLYDNNKLLASRTFDSKDKQDKAYSYFIEELRKSNETTKNYIKTYEEIIDNYKKRKVRDFKRRFKIEK